METSEQSWFTTQHMAFTALCTAILCIIAPIALPIPFSPVPITLATLMIYLIAYLFGFRLAVLSVILYLLLGTSGFPVFSGYAGGIAKLAGPTGGYLMGYLAIAGISGYIMEHCPGKLLFDAAGMAAGTLACYYLGTLWLSLQMRISFFAGLSVGVLPYLPGDAVKILLVVFVGPVLKRRLLPYMETRSPKLKME